MKRSTESINEPLVKGDRVQLRGGSRSKGTIITTENLVHAGGPAALVRFDLGHQQWNYTSDLRRVDRFYVRDLGRGITRDVRDRYEVVDTQTSQIVDSYKSKRAADMDAKQRSKESR